jgi:hypothetical protein
MTLSSNIAWGEIAIQDQRRRPIFESWLKLNLLITNSAGDIFQHDQQLFQAPDFLFTL